MTAQEVNGLVIGEVKKVIVGKDEVIDELVATLQKIMK